MNKRKIGLLFIILLLILILGGCWLFKNGQVNEGGKEKLVLAAYAGDTGSLVYIAEEQGFFDEAGLDVTIKDYEAGKLATDALLAGEADLSTATESVLVSNSFINPDLRVLSTVARAKLNYLVARKDRDIYRVEDVRGKRVGVTRKSTGEFYLGSLLLYHGLAFTDVKIVDLKPNEIVRELVEGNIDAGFTWDPNVYDIERSLGDKAISWPGQSEQDMFFLLITTADWLDKNQVAAKRLLVALIQAEKYVKEHPDEAKNYIKNKFNYSSEYLHRGWANHDFEVGLSQDLILAMEDQARWRIETGLANGTKKPNYLDFLYLDLLLQIKPEAVSVIY